MSEIIDNYLLSGVNLLNKPSIMDIVNLFLMLNDGDFYFLPELDGWLFYSEGQWKVFDSLPNEFLTKLVDEVERELREYFIVNVGVDEQTISMKGKWLKILREKLVSPVCYGQIERVLRREPKFHRSYKDFPGVNEVLPLKTIELGGRKLRKVLELRTGRVRTAKREEIYFADSNFDVALGWKCWSWERLEKESKWFAVMKGLFCGDEAKMRAFARMLGYCLIGGNPEQLIFWLKGAKRTGKSVLMDSFTALMGEGKLSMQLSPATLSAGGCNTAQAGYEKGHLIGKRFVKISEPDDKIKLSAGILKTMSGDDTMMVRQIGKDIQMIKIDFKLLFMANGLPTVTDESGALSERLVLIDCPAKTIELDDRESGLAQRLQIDEMECILSVALLGVMDYYQNGMQLTAEVRGVQQSNLLGTSVLQDFIEDEIDLTKMNQTGLPIEGMEWIKLQTIYARYQRWCKRNGHNRLMISSRFSTALKYTFPELETKTSNGKHIRGLALQKSNLLSYDDDSNIDWPSEVTIKVTK